MSGNDEQGLVVTWSTVFKVCVWGAPILISVGMSYQQLGDVQADLARLEVRLDSEADRLGGRLDTHEALPAHPSTAMRLDRLEATQIRILGEQAEAAKSLAAICQATGARCR